jgi:hypothetical protein
MIDAIGAIAAQHADTVQVWEFGRSIEDRPLLAVEVSSTPGDVTRPVLLLDGGMHANEVMSGEVVLDALEKLAGGGGSDPEIARWVETFRFFLIPQVNPDGAAIAMTEQPMWRKNARPIEERTVGVDLNRNFPTDGERCNGSSPEPRARNYRGPSEASEPETRAMMGLIESLRPVAGISYHSLSEVVLIPGGCPDGDDSQRDLLRQLGEYISEGITDDEGRTGTYRVGTPPELLYPTDGGSMEWALRTAHMLGFVVELNSERVGQRPDYGQWRDITVERQEGGWRQLVRAVENNSVRAQVQVPDGAEVTFHINPEDGSGDPAPSPRRLRGDGSLLFETLEPGTYQLVFGVNGQEGRSIDLSITGEGTIDLGTIQP